MVRRRAREPERLRIAQEAVGRVAVGGRHRRRAPSRSAVYQAVQRGS